MKRFALAMIMINFAVCDEYTLKVLTPGPVTKLTELLEIINSCNFYSDSSCEKRLTRDKIQEFIYAKPNPFLGDGDLLNTELQNDGDHYKLQYGTTQRREAAITGYYEKAAVNKMLNLASDGEVKFADLFALSHEQIEEINRLGHKEHEELQKKYPTQYSIYDQIINLLGEKIKSYLQISFCFGYAEIFINRHIAEIIGKTQFMDIFKYELNDAEIAYIYDFIIELGGVIFFLDLPPVRQSFPPQYTMSTWDQKKKAIEKMLEREKEAVQRLGALATKPTDIGKVSPKILSIIESIRRGMRVPVTRL